MPMETLLTLAIILGVPLWLAVEELMHRFTDTRRGLKPVHPPVTAGVTTRDARPPKPSMETTSHVA